MIRRLKLKKDNNYEGAILKEGCIPISKVITNIGKNILELSDGKHSFGACINCIEKPCYRLLEQEVNSDILDGLPYNNDRRVCPSEAISVIENKGIQIDTDLCIGCAICVTRCPTGGINMGEDGLNAVPNYELGELFERINSPDKDKQIETIAVFNKAKVTYSIDKITALFGEKFVDNFKAISKRNRSLELIFLRNLLIQLNIPVKSSATGNNDSRADLISCIDDYYLPIESELQGSDILGLPRRILENIAYLHTHHKINKGKIKPIASILLFPRKRSDIYEVIADIKNITGFEIKILPLYVLYLFNLFGIKITIDNILEDFYIDNNDLNFSQYIKKYIPEIEKIDGNFGSELTQLGK